MPARFINAEEFRWLLSLAGLDDDALAFLVLIGLVSPADAQYARRLRRRPGAEL